MGLVDPTQPGMGLYLITDRKNAGGRDLAEVVEAALEGGARFIQLREKDLGGRDLLGLARRLKPLTAGAGAKLIINDRVDVALASDADGVHLGVGSIPPEDARKLMGDEKLIGVSTHGLEEARAAVAGGADFITLGPVWRTSSKEKYGPPVGLDTLREVAGEAEIPVYALGGVKPGRVKEALGAGASGVALISAVMASEDVRGSVEEILTELSYTGGEQVDVIKEKKTDG